MKNQLQQDQRKIKADLVAAEADIRSTLASTDFSLVTIGGRTFNGGKIDVIQRAAYIASEVGIGGCKSITEFVNMIDEEDPTILDLFQLFLTKKKAIENGVDIEDKDYEDVEVTVKEKVAKKVRDDSEILKKLLLDNGISKDRIDDLKNANVAMGAINSKRSYATLTSRDLASPDFDLEKVMAEINEDLRNAKTFKISSRTFKPLS